MLALALVPGDVAGMLAGAAEGAGATDAGAGVVGAA
jgi:hypothetical protein